MDSYLRDTLCVLFCLLMILVGYILHKLIRMFIRSKPEGNITAVAKIHINASYALQCFNISILIFPCIRIIFGFLPLTGVIFVEVLRGILWVITNVFFAYAAAVKTGFMINFGRLSDMSEDKILHVMYIVTAVWTGAGFGLDLLWKWYRGLALLEDVRTLNHLYYGGMEMLDEMTESCYATIFIAVTFFIFIGLHLISGVVKTIK